MIGTRLAQARKGTQFNCFSPPVMLVTFGVEIVLALYVFWRFKLDMAARLAVLMLVLLAVFQLSEYFVCGGAGLSSSGWSRLGYASITLLPSLGLHLLYVVAGNKDRRLVRVGYATAVGFIIFFLGYSEAFRSYQCTGNYVIFQLATNAGMVYGLYYYGWLTTVLYLGVCWARQLQAQAKKTATSEANRKALVALVMGYLVFLVPTAIANSVKPETRQGIPSIMCGFAVIFAVILAVYIVPAIGKLRSRPPGVK